MKYDRTECLLCRNNAVEQHHIFNGHGTRPLADEYGYIVPLCHIHHEWAHRQKNEAQCIIFERLGLDNDDWIRCRRIMNNNSKDWLYEDETFIEKIGHYIQDKFE